MFLFISEGTEDIRMIPGNQTTLDLKDLTVGVSYGVSVTALVGENEGDPVTVYIKPGESSMVTMWCCVLYSNFPFLFLSIYLPVSGPQNINTAERKLCVH